MRLNEFFEDGHKGNRLSAARLAGLSLVFASILLAFTSVALAWRAPKDIQPLWLSSLVGELLASGLVSLGLRTKGEKPNAD